MSGLSAGVAAADYIHDFRRFIRQRGSEITERDARELNRLLSHAYRDLHTHSPKGGLPNDDMYHYSFDVGPGVEFGSLGDADTSVMRSGTLAITLARQNVGTGRRLQEMLVNDADRMGLYGLAWLLVREFDIR